MAVLERARAGRVELLTLNRPERLNAINRELLSLLEAAVAEVAADGDVTCLVVTGAGGRAFSAGADIAELSLLDPFEAIELMSYGQRVFTALEDCPKPVLAAIAGYALGGGLELALACDLRIAARDARLGQPEIMLANLPGWGGTQRLPRIVGEGAAKDLIFTGRTLGAVEALELGLVNRVTDGPVLEVTLQLADSLAGHAPTALALAKQAVHASRLPGQHGYTVERQAVALCFGTPQQREALRRFISKGAESDSEHNRATEDAG